MMTAKVFGITTVITVRYLVSTTKITHSLGGNHLRM